jgi:ABC-type bacteriocin/lantibiotic exporter with double-glycine peptidase domain
MPGCAAPGMGRPLPPPAEQGRVQLDVPFFPDDTDQCGPSALASVLGFWGRKAEPVRIKEEIYRAELKGSLPVDLLLAAQAHGMTAEMPDETLDSLKKELDAGHPVIAFVNQGYRFLPIGHYLVVTGYDDRRGEIFAHSGTKKNDPVPYGKFLRQWDRTDRWTLLILPAAL